LADRHCQAKAVMGSEIRKILVRANGKSEIAAEGRL
jgi:hypothetical protein